MHLPPETTIARSAAKAAPWWIALGVTGVAIAVLSGKAPLLASLALIGIGSDADLGRRLREAMASDETDLAKAADPALVAGFVRRLHAAMYGVLIVFAWASLLHLAGQSTDDAGPARWWLAGDLLAAAVLGLGYARLVRRQE